MEEFYNIYGVKNDPGIEKLLAILDECEIEYRFYDIRSFPPTHEQLDRWAEFEGVDLPINERSSFVKKNRKKYSKLPLKEQKDWLIKNYIAIVRPIIDDETEEVLSIGGRPERLAKTIFGLSKDYT